MKRVLVGYPLDRYKELEDILRPLKAKFRVVFEDYNAGWLRRNAHLFHILIPSLKVNIDKDIIRRAESLEFIFTPTTGTDHLKFDIERSGVKVYTLLDFPKEIESISSSAELAFAFILLLSRRIFLAAQDVLCKGRWQRNDFVGHELRNKTLGILGLGRIGIQVAGYARAFGMRIIYWDVEKKSSFWEWEKTVNGLFKKSDYIVCALALKPQTRYLVNKKNARFFKKGAFFINISRGKIVDEAAVCRALDKGILRGIGADVLDEELNNFKKSFLYCYARKHPEKNILITPHIGGATIEAWREVFSLVSRKIISTYTNEN